MAEDPDDSSDETPHDEEPVDSTGSSSPDESDPPEDNDRSEGGDGSEPIEDDEPEDGGQDTDGRADDDVPVLDGSDADTDDSGGLTKLDDSGPASSGGAGLESGSGGGTGTPSEETINPPGAPPSGPTRSQPDDQAGDTGSSTSEPDEAPAADSASDPNEEAATDGESVESDAGTENDPDQSGEPGCDAAPPDDEDNLDHIRTDEAVVNPASDDERTATQEATTPSAVEDGPPDDEEMPLTEHIREMVSRLAVVAIIAAGVAVLSYPLSEEMITQMWYHVHPGSHGVCGDEPLNPAHGCAPPHVYGPLEFILTKLKFSGLVGLVTAIPFAVYQTYLFMRPGLYPSERRYYLASVPLSLVLALIGMAFAFLVILPLLFEYFLQYTAETVDVAFQLSDTVDLMLVLMGWSALIFQIPLMMTLAVMMGVTTRRWMQQKRIYFWAGFGGIAFFFVAADPTGMASVLLTITMIILFEVTLLLLRWTGR